MKVCDMCRKELKYTNTVNITVEEVEIGELNEHYHFEENHEICKECWSKIQDKIQGE